MRLRLDPALLKKYQLDDFEMSNALSRALPALAADPDAQPEDDPALTWRVTYGGPQPPNPKDIADTKIALPVSPEAAPKGKGEKEGDAGHAEGVAPPRSQLVRLGDLVLKNGGIEPLQSLDEQGVQLGSQQYDRFLYARCTALCSMSIYQLPGSNALDTARGVYAKMRELKTRFPGGLDYKIVYDTTPFISESVSEVFYTLRDAVILVAIVVLLFLQDWRAMILPMIDVPVSLIGTFAVMAAMGFTLNNLTLFGLVLAIGIVVDDAIVVLENIERQIGLGYDARTRDHQGDGRDYRPRPRHHAGLDAAVFIPCCFLGGITGQFFRQFAVTIAVSTIISAINASNGDAVPRGHDLQDRRSAWRRGKWQLSTGRRHAPLETRGAPLVDLRLLRRLFHHLAVAEIAGGVFRLARGQHHQFSRHRFHV